MVAVVSVVLFLSPFLFLSRDAISALYPSPQIDPPAAVGTERAVGIPVPRHWGTAYGTLDAETHRPTLLPVFAATIYFDDQSDDALKGCSSQKGKESKSKRRTPEVGSDNRAMSKMRAEKLGDR